MVYQGRVGLKDDWLKYQAQARKSRKEAERVAQQQREQLLETIGYIAAGLIAFSGAVAAIYGLGVYMGKW